MRFARNDIEQATVIFIHLGDARKHADRTGNRGQRIANFVRDCGGQASNGCKPVLHAHFPLQAANLSEIVEHVDIPDVSTLRHRQSRDAHAQRLAEAVGSIEPNFAMQMFGTRP